jgi:hypothetical protein
MLLEPEQPEHSSSAVKTKPIGTDQLRLLKTPHGKATGTQKRQLELRPASGEVMYDVTVLVSHGFVTVS